MSKLRLFVGQEHKFAYMFRDADGALVTPASGLVEIRDTEGAIVVASTAMTVASNVASYLHAPAAAGEFIAYFKVTLPGRKPMKDVAFRVVAPDGVSQ